MQKYTRDDLIDNLIKDDLYIQETEEAADYLDNILRSGFKGYSHFTDGELIEEFNTRTDEEWNFIK
ncbi:MAG: hypothetical protein WC549_00440 [Actinomycetota bacterium]